MMNDELEKLKSEWHQEYNRYLDIWCVCDIPPAKAARYSRHMDELRGRLYALMKFERMLKDVQTKNI
jgi:hypothetical protein